MDKDKPSSDDEECDNCVRNPSGSQPNNNFNNGTNFNHVQTFDDKRQ